MEERKFILPLWFALLVFIVGKVSGCTKTIYDLETKAEVQEFHDTTKKPVSFGTYFIKPI